MHILKHPALGSVDRNTLHSCIDCVPRGYISHASMSEPGVAGLKLGHQPVDFLLECLWFVAAKDLIPSTPSECRPIHTTHAGIEVLRLHQTADLVENFRAFMQTQIHCCLIPIGVDTSPTATNAAQ